MPAIATFGLGVALLLPLRARTKRVRAPRPEAFAAAMSGAAALAPTSIEAGRRPDLDGAVDANRPAKPAPASRADHHAVEDHTGNDYHFSAAFGILDTAHIPDSFHIAEAGRVDDYDLRGDAGLAERSRRMREAEIALDAERARRPRSSSERKVPLTRLPLRRPAETVGWPLLLDGEYARCNRDARHRLLAEFIRAGGGAEAVLVAAYRQEDAAGRVLALRALKLHASSDLRAIFQEALRDGSDDERATAVEALAVRGPRESLLPALTDPVDAIAARAALGYVGSRERADYHLTLAPLLDPSRIDALLSLLAGYLE